MQDVRAVFSSFTDEQWQFAIEASLYTREQHGVRLPGFPDDALQSHTVGSSGENTLREAGNFYRLVKRMCSGNGLQIGPETDILDFGISWGRIVRFFLRDTDPGHLFGVDINADYLEVARATDCPATLARIEPRGRLPYENGAMDLVYAYWVFTHLPEDVQDRWLAQIRRVLRPGGIFIATVEPPRFIDNFLRVDCTKPNMHPWHADMAAKIQADRSLTSRLWQSGIVHIASSVDFYGDTVMTPGYVSEHWGKYFEIIEFLDDPSRFWQAIVTCRAKS